VIVPGDGVQIADASGHRVGWHRPVALPEDIDDPSIEKAHGLVRLPGHVWWSGPDRLWNLTDPRQCARLYEILLTEGTDDDVRRFIEVDKLVRLWDVLWVPPHVRTAWRNHIYRLRGVDLGC
jgi:hypothetical protein